MPKVRRRSANNWLLYVFLFLLPLQNLQTGYMPNLGGGLNFLNIMTAASLAGALAIGGRLAPGEPVNRWVLAYVLYAVVSLFVGYQYVTDSADHLAILKDHVLGLAVVFLVQMSVHDWTTVRRVILATVLPLPYIARVTWAQHTSVASWHYSDDLRISGTFSLLGANEFAAFCVTVGVVLFALLISARLSWRWRLLLGVGMACTVMGVLYAYSRTGYISLILGLVAVILVWRGRWKLLLPLLLAAALLPGLLPYSVVERFDSTNVDAGERDESTELRFVYWQVAWDNFTRHPIVGTGFQSFHHPEINPYRKDTHNLYLRTLTEGGVIGALVLLGLLLAILRTALREMAHSRSGTLRYALALGVTGAWIGLICGNLFGDRFTYYPMAAYFWAYVALVVKARHLPAEEAP
ncbi:O-antigen ligase family protein [Lysobacter sp. H21R4]|uniref:O-antigen ligase family protein n=1 Tax=Lysobacter sp. H21R4 TaxID=2781021 RepID=UPI001886BB3E|nr:O-antigen ligase family protein [Lysobacter sp. H21R4]QOY61979.1 O-antigen ligase family protein [Lysobacter sp. H21R4]